MGSFEGLLELGSSRCGRVVGGESKSRSLEECVRGVSEVGYQ